MVQDSWSVLEMQSNKRYICKWVSVLGTEVRKDGGRHGTGKVSRNYFRELLKNYVKSNEFLLVIFPGAHLL